MVKFLNCFVFVFFMGKFNAVVYSLKKFAVGVYATLQLALPIKSFAGDVSLSGRVVNDQGVGQANKNVVLFLNNNEKKLNGVTGADGVYVIPFTPSGVRHEHFLPEGYSVSNNYPNPFNPATNVNVTVPKRSSVQMKVYSLLGEELGIVIDKDFDAGVHGVNVDLEHFNVAQGVYFARTVIDEQYVKVSKLLFLRNSQHARAFSNDIVSSGASGSFGKTSIEDIIDSMYVNGRSILPTSKFLGVIISGNTDLGSIVVDSAFNVDGRLISTIRYDQPNNHLPNLTVIIDGYSALTDSLGMFSVQVPVDSHAVAPFYGMSPWHRKMDIVDPSIWTRKKHLYVRGDTTDVIEDVLTKEDFPDSVMNFMNYISNRNGTGGYDVLKRFIDKPSFYVVADTSIAWDKEFYDIWGGFIKGKLNDVLTGRLFPEGFLKDVIINSGTNPPIQCDENNAVYTITPDAAYGNAVLATSPCARGPPPMIISCITKVGMYPTPMDFDYMKRALGHELASGLGYMPNRSNALMSWYNLGNPLNPDPTNPTQTDLLILRYVFSRPTGMDFPDVDWERSPKNPISVP